MPTLSEELQKEFKLTPEGEVSYIGTGPFKIESKAGTISIPLEYMWFLPRFSADKTEITSVLKIIKHSYCIILYKEYSLHSQIIRQGWIVPPNLGYGFYEIELSSGMIANGEASTDNAKLKGFIGTIAYKRAFDRAVILALDLYEKGFYSEEEVTTEMKNGSTFATSAGVTAVNRDLVRQVLTTADEKFDSPYKLRKWLKAEGFEESKKFLDMDKHTLESILMRLQGL